MLKNKNGDSPTLQQHLDIWDTLHFGMESKLDLMMCSESNTMKQIGALTIIGQVTEVLNSFQHPKTNIKIARADYRKPDYGINLPCNYVALPFYFKTKELRDYAIELIGPEILDYAFGNFK